MGYYSTLEIEMDKLKKVKSLDELDLTEDEKEFLIVCYPDMRIEDGYIELDEWFRKNYENEKLISIIKKICERENTEIVLHFIGEDGFRWDFKITPTKVYESEYEIKWKEV